jgi:hypothetical protein
VQIYNTALVIDDEICADLVYRVMNKGIPVIGEGLSLLLRQTVGTIPGGAGLYDD